MYQTSRRATMTPISDWRQLPFDEIWIVDFEFYPGPGKAQRR